MYHLNLNDILFVLSYIKEMFLTGTFGVIVLFLVLIVSCIVGFLLIICVCLVIGLFDYLLGWIFNIKKENEE